jgi:hypothetical protein
MPTDYHLSSRYPSVQRHRLYRHVRRNHAGKYQQTTPEVRAEHLDGISFSDASYLMPWALYTIPPGTIQNGRMKGELTDAGRTLMKKSLISLVP